MTVNQLIRKLQKMQRDLVVCIDLNDEDGGSYSDFTIQEHEGCGVAFRPDDLDAVVTKKGVEYPKRNSK